MTPIGAFLKTVAFFLTCFLAPLFACALLVLVLGVASGIIPTPWNPACMTQTLREISNLSGYDFKITETNCDLLAKDDAIRVFISPTGKHQDALLFQFDPVYLRGEGYVMPTITVSDEGNVSMSVREVASIAVQKPRWQNISIEYDIGRIQYPNVKKAAE